MGEFTKLEDPKIDLLIREHLDRIVEAVLSRFSPFSIVLRGSFGRGEGSVLPGENGYHFLSDYEIDVITNRPFYRKILSGLTHQLSKELQVETGLRWNREDVLSHRRVGPFPVGPAEKTISLYEFRYGSLILWGKDFISDSPQILAEDLKAQSGIQLMLNRMAESLFYMDIDCDSPLDNLNVYYWINKVVLSCAEALLICWKQYHYSYLERGRRFGRLGEESLNFMPDQKELLLQLVERATRFKLQPDPALYDRPARETWQQIIPVCDQVFRYLLKEVEGISFTQYAGLPRITLHQHEIKMNFKEGILFSGVRLLEWNKALHSHQPFPHVSNQLLASQIIYAIVPLLFFSYGQQDAADSLAEARNWLAKFQQLNPPSMDLQQEWNYLRMQLAKTWKVFCY